MAASETAPWSRHDHCLGSPVHHRPHTRCPCRRPAVHRPPSTGSTRGWRGYALGWTSQVSQMTRYLTVEEVADMLRVSVSWVYKHKELLGGVRLGDRFWRFPEQQLLGHLAPSQPSA